MSCAKSDIATIMMVSMWYGAVLLSGMTAQVRTFHRFIDYPIRTRTIAMDSLLGPDSGINWTGLLVS